MKSTNWMKRNIRIKAKKISEQLFTDHLTPHLPQTILVYQKPRKGIFYCELNLAKQIILKGGEEK